MHGLIESVCRVAAKAALFLAAAGVVCSPTAAQGAIKYFRLFKSASYQQTTNAQPSTPDVAWANLDIFSDNASDLNSATVTAASPLSPINLSLAGPGYSPPYTAFTFSTAYATIASLTTNYPNSTAYQFAISGGVLGNQSASLTTPATNLFSVVPYFNGSTFAQSQGLNSALPFTFAWDGFSVGGPVNLELAYFTISRISDGQVAYSTVKGNGASSVILLANTLQPNTAYNATLIYDARIEGPNAGFNGATSEIAFDQRVNLVFSTRAVPEPSGLVLAAVGLLSLVVWRRRKR